MEFLELISQALSAYLQQSEPDGRSAADFGKFVAKFKPAEPASDG